MNAAQAEELSPSLGPSSDTQQSADPTDYSVAKDNTIRVAAAETLGHYAEWLGVSAGRLRQVNKMKFAKPVLIGHRIKLEFGRVSREDFETKRREYHVELQATYFAEHRIIGTEVYIVRRGDALWNVTQRFDQLPIWLLQQYNPDVDLADLRPGTQIVMPRVENVVAGPGTRVGEVPRKRHLKSGYRRSNASNDAKLFLPPVVVNSSAFPSADLACNEMPFRISKALQPISRQLEIPLRPPRHRRAIRRPRQTQLRQINFDGRAIRPNTRKVAPLASLMDNGRSRFLAQRLQAQGLPVAHHVWLSQLPLRLGRRDPQEQLLRPHPIGLKRRNVCKRIRLLAAAGL